MNKPALSAPSLSRRSFLQVLGAGVVVSAAAPGANAQRRGSREELPIEARLHLGEDGTITVLTGKVEVGQGARAQIAQAAAEELRLDVGQIRVIMADTSLVPNDGTTAGSRTTPRTIPAVRRAAAALRQGLTELACKQWGVKPSDVQVRDGAVVQETPQRSLTYAQLAKDKDATSVFKRAVPNDIELRSVSEWEVLGTSVTRPNRRELLTGAHRFPSDIERPNMLHGKVLRPPSYGAILTAIDLSEAQAMDKVTVVREGDFVACAAPTSFEASQAVKALAKTAKWETQSHPSSEELFPLLKRTAKQGRGRRSSGASDGSVDEALAKANKTLRESYEVAYVQHAPMEPRAAVAEWNNGKLTVWTGSTGPNRVHGQLADAFDVPRDRVRVIVPDTGCSFGGKHSGEAAVEAARIAKAVQKPVSLRWTRKEEFTWAYFRPAALIEVAGGLDADGALTAWEMTTYNPGGSGLQTPYTVPNTRHGTRNCDAPLRQGSYRCLAATANNFARESFMDELAAEAGTDPLTFRLNCLEDPRLRAVLEAAADRFRWNQRKKQHSSGVGVGLACCHEKDSYVAACVEVKVNRSSGNIDVRHVCEVFECGAVQNPRNLRSQVAGCIIMGLGPALFEAITFKGGAITSDSFAKYRVPRFKDVPPLDIHLLERPDLPSVGGGETPITVIAPAIANAVFDATGIRLRSMPLSSQTLKETRS